MALDAIAIRSITNEIKNEIIGGRIDKIHQPERDEIMLHIRTVNNSYSLLISASAAHPRLHFTKFQKKNPSSPPMFCMLMRKHLNGGKIIDVRQVGFERIVIIDIESRDELGDLTVKHIVVEIMGRYSNIILTNSDMKILDSVKHIDFTVSSVRQILPGMMYEYPPTQNKKPLTEFDGKFMADCPAGTLLDKAVLSEISGISPLIAREIVYRAYGELGLKLSEISSLEILEKSIFEMSECVRKNEFTPCIIKDEKALKIFEFSAVTIKQYEGLMKVIPYSSMNELLDEFYSSRDALERMKQKSSDVVKLLHTLLERAYKKRLILKQTISDSEKKETYKIYGDLLTANVYMIKQGEKSVEVINYYDDNKSVKIPLDTAISPSQNAQKYYKKYRKAKTAETEAETQNKINEDLIEYLESTLVNVSNCTSEEDINAIREELAGEGFLKRVSVKKNKSSKKPSPLHYVSSDGFDIYIGKNNTQNDYITLKLANSSDLWFHTKQIHGSHTIIKLGINKNIPETTMREAAELAAYYSKGRNSSQVPVDYTQIKNVKKPSGAKPGMVIYDNYNTVYVTPKNHLSE